jgi:N utilization substance protein A
LDPNIERLVHVVADAEQLSLAIGKKGQNVRLTARLLDCKIDVQKDESDVSFEEKVGKAVENLAAVDGISRENAEALVKSGFLTVDGILAAEISDLEETAGFSEEEAKAIYEAASRTQA